MRMLIMSFFILGSYVTFAQTNMNSEWICTTNASSSEVIAYKDADDKMENTQGSATQSFAFAAQNCRDCTKITCEIKD